MPKISKPSTKKTITKTKKVAAVVQKATKVIKKT
jgi:DnaK suppressor protein